MSTLESKLWAMGFIGAGAILLHELPFREYMGIVALAMGCALWIRRA